jgi:uncharacterized Zn finger protein
MSKEKHEITPHVCDCGNDTFKVEMPKAFTKDGIVNINSVESDGQGLRIILQVKVLVECTKCGVVTTIFNYVVVRVPGQISWQPTDKDKSVMIDRLEINFDLDKIKLELSEKIKDKYMTVEAHLSGKEQAT